MNHTWIKFLPHFVRTRLDGRHILQKVIANTGWLFLDQMLRMAVGLFVTVWVARYLGPEGFGILNYAIAFVALFSAFATMGLNSIVVRSIVNEPASTNETLGAAFVLKLFGGLCSLILAYTIISFMRPADTTTNWMVVIISAGMVFQAFDTIDLWFQSQLRSKYTVYAKNLAFLLASLGKIGLIIIKAPIIAFAWIGLFEVIGGSFGLIIAYRVNGHTLWQWRTNLNQAKKLLNDSWPLILSGLAIYIQAKIDHVMLGEMIGLDEVGQYSVAMRLIEVFGFMPIIICSSVGPSVTEAKALDEGMYYERLLNIYRLMFILFLVISVPVFIFSTPIVVTLFGADYRPAGELLAIFSIRLFFANFGVARSLFITNEGLFRYALITAVIGAAVNIALNYILIPVYASVGAVLSTILSFAATTFLVDVFYWRAKRNFWTMCRATVTPWQLKLR